jgi:tRNA-splicing ligase RtcB
LPTGRIPAMPRSSSGAGRKIIDDLAPEGIPPPAASPGAYKDIGAVVAAAENAGLARRVARLRSLICIKG